MTTYGVRDKCCGLWSWGGKPLVDRETHQARKAAHKAFDPLWKKEGLDRGVAYSLLAEHLGISVDECHMASMDSETARRVPDIVEIIRAGRD